MGGQFAMKLQVIESHEKDYASSYQLAHDGSDFE